MTRLLTKLRCHIGLHRWAPWGRLRIQAPGQWHAEGRFCLRCDVAERRWTA